MSIEKGPSQEDVDSSPEKYESPENQPLNEYKRQMENALADLIVEKAESGEPSDIKASYIESLAIIRAFDIIDKDLLTERINDSAVQKHVDEVVAKLGLENQKFSVLKYRGLFNEGLELKYSGK